MKVITRSEFHYNLLISVATHNNKRDQLEQYSNQVEACMKQPRKLQILEKGKCQTLC